jgi:multicomponent Na+:H+ antiporter subunit G
MIAVADALAAVCLIAGALLTAAAGIGVLRFPDVLSRLHAVSKPQVLGLLLILAGVALRLGSWAEVPTLILIGIFQMATAPVAAHVVAGAAYRSHVGARERLLVDELE